MYLSDFEDYTAKGTLGKNRQLYTNLYDFYINSDDNKNREKIVAWMGKGSQKKNFSYVIPHLENGDYILDYGCGIGDLIPALENNLDYFSYVGVDINAKFIKEAERSYPDYPFYKIDSAHEIERKYDVIVAIGVFTWFITKKDFEQTIRHLYSICNQKLIITCIHSSITRHSWTSTYRGYDEDIFLEIFPELEDNMKFEYKDQNMVVIFTK
jgi:cyclopropane fatty-acyl-phospholipid synthase-like methyltransferase